MSMGGRTFVVAASRGKRQSAPHPIDQDRNLRIGDFSRRWHLNLLAVVPNRFDQQTSVRLSRLGGRPGVSPLEHSVTPIEHQPTAQLFAGRSMTFEATLDQDRPYSLLKEFDIGIGKSYRVVRKYDCAQRAPRRNYPEPSPGDWRTEHRSRPISHHGDMLATVGGVTKSPLHDTDGCGPIIWSAADRSAGRGMVNEQVLATSDFVASRSYTATQLDFRRVPRGVPRAVALWPVLNDGRHRPGVNDCSKVAWQ